MQYETALEEFEAQLKDASSSFENDTTSLKFQLIIEEDAEKRIPKKFIVEMQQRQQQGEEEIEEEEEECEMDVELQQQLEKLKRQQKEQHQNQEGEKEEEEALRMPLFAEVIIIIRSKEEEEPDQKFLVGFRFWSSSNSGFCFPEKDTSQLFESVHDLFMSSPHAPAGYAKHFWNNIGQKLEE